MHSTSDPLVERSFIVWFSPLTFLFLPEKTGKRLWRGSNPQKKQNLFISPSPSWQNFYHACVPVEGLIFSQIVDIFSSYVHSRSYAFRNDNGKPYDRYGAMMISACQASGSRTQWTIWGLQPLDLTSSSYPQRQFSLRIAGTMVVLYKLDSANCVIISLLTYVKGTWYT